MLSIHNIIIIWRVRQMNDGLDDSLASDGFCFYTWSK